MTEPAAAVTAGSFLTLAGIEKRYGQLAAVDGVDLAVREGEVFCLLGESGSGKSTLLRTLAGFVFPDAGRVCLDGRDITLWPPYRRPVNMMFQSYALFPHLTVSGNVRFGLEREGLARTEIARRLDEVLPLLRLEALAERRPHQLSGGQQQRVALARCLVKRPRLLLLDEPLAALDRKLRESTQYELLRLQAQLGITFVIVTHDRDEAMTMAHRIGVMRGGRLAQVGTPEAVYERPASRFVAEFLGTVNFVEGRVGERGEGVTLVHSDAWPHPLCVQTEGTSPAPVPGEAVTVAVRPERLRLLPPDGAAGVAAENVAAGHVEQRVFRGDQSACVVRCGSLRLQVTVAHGAGGGRAVPGPPDAVRVAFAPGDAILLHA